MEIGRHNYEEYFLDYFEGNLSSEKKERLFTFLVSHPDLQKEFENFESITLDNEHQEFENKQLLNKFEFNQLVNENNFEQFSIAFLERDLSEEQKSRFLEFLKTHPEQEDVFKIFQRAKLHPQEEIIFFGKETLKKAGSILPLFVKRLAVAASVVLLGGFVFFMLEGERHPENSPVSESIPNISYENTFVQESISEDKVAVNVLLETTELYQKDVKYIQTDIYTTQNEVEIEVERFYLKSIPVIVAPKVNSAFDRSYFASIDIPGATGDKEEDPFDIFSNIRRNLDDFALSVNTDGIDGSGRISIWDVASFGINGIGRLTGADIRVEKKKDDDGNVTALAFQSRNLNFTKRINY